MCSGDTVVGVRCDRGSNCALRSAGVDVLACCAALHAIAHFIGDAALRVSMPDVITALATMNLVHVVIGCVVHRSRDQL